MRAKSELDAGKHTHVHIHLFVGEWKQNELRAKQSSPRFFVFFAHCFGADAKLNEFIIGIYSIAEQTIQKQSNCICTKWLFCHLVRSFPAAYGWVVWCRCLRAHFPTLSLCPFYSAHQKLKRCVNVPLCRRVRWACLFVSYMRHSVIFAHSALHIHGHSALGFHSNRSQQTTHKDTLSIVCVCVCVWFGNNMHILGNSGSAQRIFFANEPQLSSPKKSEQKKWYVCVCVHSK